MPVGAAAPPSQWAPWPYKLGVHHRYPDVSKQAPMLRPPVRTLRHASIATSPAPTFTPSHRNTPRSLGSSSPAASTCRLPSGTCAQSCGGGGHGQRSGEGGCSARGEGVTGSYPSCFTAWGEVCQKACSSGQVVNFQLVAAQVEGGFRPGGVSSPPHHRLHLCHNCCRARRRAQGAWEGRLQAAPHSVVHVWTPPPHPLPLLGTRARLRPASGQHHNPVPFPPSSRFSPHGMHTEGGPFGAHLLLR
jgi:hypothetical protein